MDMRIILHLVRHGRTLWNEERRYLGHEDQGILMEGRQQLLPLRGRYFAKGFARIYCSDLLRCRQTLNVILSDSNLAAVPNEEVPGEFIPGVEYDLRLRELDFGDWEGNTYEDLKSDLSYRRWIDNPAEVTPPNGESWEAFRSRVQAFLTGLYYGLGTQRAEPEVLVVTHGGVIRQIVAATLPHTEFWATSVSPGEALTLQLTWDGQQWQGVRLSE
ncbi:histidine phosphatase family protein [Paenibacillus solani]|uniref:Phosphoglycerate mutase n=1 Tax=Paenibacillus solani TaxID=1705565 RepID=A0A0M1NJV6_9BACL|nr:histidine phosphatase family protein [Paenibacillus solani]KOR82372.1 phosphoglycerate mutase [Paenibacillus solani]